MMARTLLPGNVTETASPASALEDSNLRTRLLAAQLLIADLGHQRGVTPPMRLQARQALEMAVHVAAQGEDFETRLLSALGTSGILGTIEVDEARRLLGTYEGNVLVLGKYRPKYYDGAVLLVRAAGAHASLPNAGWQEVVKDLEIRFTGGDHFSIMRPPDVTQMAEVISNGIDDALLRFSPRLQDPGSADHPPKLPVVD